MERLLKPAVYFLAAVFAVIFAIYADVDSLVYVACKIVELWKDIFIQIMSYNITNLPTDLIYGFGIFMNSVHCGVATLVNMPFIFIQFITGGDITKYYC